ncbi:MAG: hypothetical protein ABIA04_06555 [Pseudomonadota bacterium]
MFYRTLLLTVIITLVLFSFKIFPVFKLSYESSELFEKASNIVHARCENKNIYSEGSLIFTSFDFTVTKKLKGSLNESEGFSIRYLGGSLNGITVRNYDLPNITQESVYKLFLTDKNDLSFYTILGYNQGIELISKQPNLKLQKNKKEKLGKAYSLFTYDCDSEIGVAHWPYSSIPVEIYMDRDALDFDYDDLPLSIHNMFNQWQSVSTSYFAFEFMGETENPISYDSISETGSIDYNSIYLPRMQGTQETIERHEIIFDKTGDIVYNLFGGDPDSVIGVGYPIIDDSTCEIIDAFLILNMKNPPVIGILEAAIAHELGHFIGVGHTTVTDTLLADIILPTLFYSVFPEDDSLGKTIEADDKAAVTALYPANNVEDYFGAIEGYVQDADGLGIFGISVIAVNTLTSEAVGSISGHNDGEDTSDGKFTIYGVLPGTYNIIAQAINGEEEISDLRGANLGGIFVDADTSFTAEILNDISFTYTSGERIAFPENALEVTVELGKTTKGITIIDDASNEINLTTEAGAFPALSGSEGYTKDTAPSASVEAEFTYVAPSSGGCG